MLKTIITLMLLVLASLTVPSGAGANDAACANCAPAADAAAFKSSLLLTLKNRSFFQAVAERARAAAKPVPALLRMELVGDVFVALVEDRSGASRFLSRGEGERYGLSDKQMFAAALGNLKRRADRVQIEEFGPVKALSFDPDYNAALLLLPDVWSSIPGLPTELVVAVPARDVVAFADGRDPAALASLRGIAGLPSKGYPVTTLLLKRAGDSWSVLK